MQAAKIRFDPNSGRDFAIFDSRLHLLNKARGKLAVARNQALALRKASKITWRQAHPAPRLPFVRAEAVDGDFIQSGQVPG